MLTYVLTVVAVLFGAGAFAALGFSAWLAFGVMRERRQFFDELSEHRRNIAKGARR